MRGAETGCGAKVIDHLRQNAGPVDRVDPGQFHPIAEFKVIEHIFEHGLAGVECALHCDGVDIGIGRRGHLTALHL